MVSNRLQKEQLPYNSSLLLHLSNFMPACYIDLNCVCVLNVGLSSPINIIVSNEIAPYGHISRIN